MVHRPAIFVSAAAPELDRFREAVVTTLRNMGAEVCEHTDYTVTDGPLDGLLRVAMGRCDAVIHLVGHTFGIEPAERVHGAPRRSFVQYEYDVAQSLRRRIFSFVAAPGVEGLACDRGDDEARMLHADHRRFVEREEHWKFTSVEQLCDTLRGLQTRLMVRRHYAHLPFPRRGRDLVGRDRTLAAVRDAVQNSRVIFLEPPVQFASSSLSAGKTAVAIEAAWRLYEMGRYDFMLWLPASSGAELENEIGLLTRMDALSLMKDEVGNHPARIDGFRRWLRAPENADRYLIILDGVDSEPAWLAASAWLPDLARGTVLLTTRLPREWPGAAHIPVGSVDADASLALLAPGLPVAKDGSLAPATLAMAERLATLLGHQPLALEVAACALAEGGRTLDQLTAQLAAARAVPTAALVLRGLRNSPAFFNLVQSSIAGLDPLAQTLLQMMACMAPHPCRVPLGIFAGRPDLPHIRAALGQIVRRGLAITADDGAAFLFHPAIREIVREGMSTDDLGGALELARTLLEVAMERGEKVPAVEVLRARLIPHCRVLMSQLHGHPQEPRSGGLARLVGGWLRERGRSVEAEPFARRALQIAERALPAEHPDLVPELRLMSAVLQDQRRFNEAAKLRRRTIGILLQQPSTRSGELVIELFSLAGCLRSGNRLTDAEPILRRAVEVEEQCSGRHHPRTAIALHALAGLLEVLHRPADAVPLYRRALEIDEHHPNCPKARLASREHHLAAALTLVGQIDEAIERHRHALTLDRKVYGRGHVELIAPLQNLAALLESKGEHAEAAEMLAEVLDIQEAMKVQVALDLAQTLVGLCSVHVALGELEKARAYGERARIFLAQAQPWNPAVRALMHEVEASLALASK